MEPMYYIGLDVLTKDNGSRISGQVRTGIHFSSKRVSF
jgi:hypothetical protein